MKHICYILIICVAVIASSGCSRETKLTTELAQRAINQWCIAANRGHVTVTGVLELPQENAARADMIFSNFTFPYRNPMFGQISNQNYSGSGVAVFAHYNDGRWILTQIILSNPGVWGPIQWNNLNIVAAGKGASTSK
jgi:hypothetical protein